MTISGRHHHRHFLDHLPKPPGYNQLRRFADRAHLPLPPGMHGPDEMGRAKKKGHKKHKFKIKLQPGKIFKKYGLATQRNAFLLLVKLNTFHLAIKMWKKAAHDKNSPAWKKLAALWAKLGGKPDKLYKEIQRGVHTYNKLHKAKKHISGYVDESVQGMHDSMIIDGLDDSINGIETIGHYDDNMTVGEILLYVHRNHGARMHKIGVVQAVAAAGVIAAAAPIIKALMGILKSFGVNTNKAAAAGDEDAQNTAKDYNAGGEPDENGNVTTDDGKKIKVTNNPDGSQNMEVNHVPGLDDKSQAEADGDDGAETTTKTKTVTKTKTKVSTGGDDDGSEGSAGFLNTVKDFVGNHKAPLAITAAGTAALIFSLTHKGKKGSMVGPVVGIAGGIAMVYGGVGLFKK